MTAKSDAENAARTIAGNGWSGGQYSLWRALFGLWLAAGAVLGLIATPARAGVLGLHAATFVASLLTAAGFRDRLAAIILFVLTAPSLIDAEPSPGSIVILLLLATHVATPRSPFLSFDARRRVDPRGEGAVWQLPGPVLLLRTGLFAGALVIRSIAGLLPGDRGVWQAVVSGFGGPWVFLRARAEVPAGVASSGSAMVIAVPAVLCVLLALAVMRPRIRPWIGWAAMGLLAVDACVGGDAVRAVTLLLLGFSAWDPARIPPATREDAPPDLLFYDGNCGLCHRAVRFVLAEDQKGGAFRFSPLGSPRFLESIPKAVIDDLPDSVVVQRPDGTILTRSRAILRLLSRLGGVWRLFAIVGRVLPVAIADRLYDLIASIRQRLFARPKEACPILPPDLRRRFV